jgi:hypothetical protein
MPHPEGLAGLLLDISNSPYRTEIRPHLTKKERTLFDLMEMQMLIRYMITNPEEVQVEFEKFHDFLEAVGIVL